MERASTNTPPNEKSDSDIEKGHVVDTSTPIAGDVEIIESESPLMSKGIFSKLWKLLSATGVELRGVQPVPEEQRTDLQYNKIFTVWFTSLICPLPLVTGMLGTLAFGLSLRDCSLLIFFFSFLLCIPPAYIETISPRTGMRQMIQARYSFGMYPNILVVILNMCSLCGYQIICLVTAGQTLAAVSNDSISQIVGIVVVGICAMVPAFFGFNFIHQYERYAWIPALIAILVAVGCGGNKLKEQAPPVAPSGQTVMIFISFIAGYMLPYSSTVGDIAVYFSPKAPKWRIFMYCWMGICLPSVLLMCLGAAIGGAVPNVPAWADAYDRDSVGGVLEVMLHPAGGFGKFIAVLLALSVVAQISPGFYSVSLNFQIIWPQFVKVPRVLFVILITAIDLGVGIKAAESFFESLESFLGVIAYWAAAFTGILLSEWFIFRKANPAAYDHKIWNVASDLPSGLAALAALIIPFALVVPSMAQTWYTGPIAEKAGDLGFEFALVLGTLIYIPARMLEIKIRGKL
ncbi:putative purine-cytosine permease FCY2 [Lophium mytilinum]|uniref:Putative purine-cytosine permease FCY2 n=1 Tax=Lophium mytilinum TaxID=390894 RepID=A0A6A6QFU3_9PEZI|nr:putative purine-cytosine permease FCY2 [Lophium mytilinum]